MREGKVENENVRALPLRRIEEKYKEGGVGEEFFFFFCRYKIRSVTGVRRKEIEMLA